MSEVKEPHSFGDGEKKGEEVHLNYIKLVFKVIYNAFQCLCLNL